MKVKFNVTLSGPDYTFHPNEIVELAKLKSLGMSDEEVKRLLDAGIFSAVSKKVEKATVK